MNTFVVKYEQGGEEKTEEVQATYTLSAELKFIDEHTGEDFQLIEVLEVWDADTNSD